MKYKVLLTGRNKTIINDFFSQLNENFESLTTSGRYEDILNHLKYFKPDVFVYCLNQETEEYISQVVSVKKRLEQKGIPIVIIGSEGDCDNFIQYSVNTADLVLVKPITAGTIMNKIIDYMKGQQRLQEEAIRAEEERLEKEKMAKRKHILVVDDDPLMLKLIKEHLHDKYNVATAPSGRIALSFLEKKKTDLILLDYEMPIENGPAVLEKLHANEGTKDIPVVFLTSITERNKIQKALSLNPQGYLLKPIDHDQLIDSIQKIIG